MQETSDNIYVLLLICIIGVVLLLVSFVIIQVRQQNRLLIQKELTDKKEIAHRKALLHSVIQSQEEERKRIGRNLHDDVGGNLAVLKMLMANHRETAPDLSLIEGVIDTVRDIAHNLSPQMINFLGLCDALEELCDRLTGTGKITAQFKCNDKARLCKWNEETALAIYRILQELIANTLKHAEATVINLHIEIKNNEVMMDYSDNGKGVDPGVKKGMGTANIIGRLEMLDAAWEINYSKEPGYRTRIYIPFNPTLSSC